MEMNREMNEHPSNSCGCGKSSKQAATIWDGTAEILLNEKVAESTYRLRLACPEIAKIFDPGQFVMLRLIGSSDPLLGRPIAVYDALDASGDSFSNDDPTKRYSIDLVYIVVGRGTTKLSTMRPGEVLEVWGPLGKPFPAYDCDHLIFIAGGIGQTPFLTLARRELGLAKFESMDECSGMLRPKKITFCYGARSADYLACVDDFRALNIDVQICTDDGSAGQKGFVTDLIRPLVESAKSEFADSARPSAHLVGCGPEPMLAAMTEIARKLDVPCHVSLETPMACGLGICFSCVTKVQTPDGDWDYKRTCIDGPIFDAREVFSDE
jgi:dihydroorotate dehydrogenase electron transfer subunit